MLSKLLKYELRASGRILLPVYALLLASAGCCSLFYKLAADHPYRTGAASVLMGLLMMAFWIFVVATGAITALLMIYRFYKNYMTDEGYLMFTLPVNRHQLIWAKLLSALLYTAASAVAVTLSILLVLLPIADCPASGAIWENFSPSSRSPSISAFPVRCCSCGSPCWPS